MSVYCGRCGHAVECGEHPERFLECQDNAARFDILKAVPEMLDALRWLLDEIEPSGDCAGVWAIPSVEAIANARAAIDKATDDNYTPSDARNVDYDAHLTMEQTMEGAER